MKKAAIYVLGILMSATMVLAQELPDTVRWMGFDQVRAAFYKKNKPILIYLYSDDCDSCSMMQSLCFGNSEVARYINYYFYPIRFDAKSYDTVTFFNGQKFYHQPRKQYHSLVTVFLKDSIHFPALVVFNKYAQGQVFYGFRDRDHIFPILIYYAEEVYTTTQYDDFEKVYYKAYPPGMKQVISRLFIHWKDINQLDSLEKRQAKMIFVDVYDRLRVAPTIMRMQVYNNPIIASYLNKHFYPVTVEARGKDTVEFNGRKYGPSDRYPYHDLAISMLGGRMKFPAFLVLDKDYKLLNREQVFLLPEDFYRIITYFGDGYYQKLSFQEYLKQYGKQLEPTIEKIRGYYR